MKEIFVTEKKILRHDEKSLQDTLQLLSQVSKDSLDILMKALETNPDLKGSLGSLHLDTGRTVWLKLEVKDSFMSSLIYKWMFSRSKFDDKSGLQVFGCKLSELMYEKPSGFTEEEKVAIKTLYQKAFGL